MVGRNRRALIQGSNCFGSLPATTGHGPISPVVRQPSRVQIRSFHYTVRSEFSQNQILHFLPDFRIVFHFRVSFAKDLLVPWDGRDIDSFFTVVELEIAKDGRPQRIFGDDGSLSSDQNTVSLKETGSTRHVGRDASISSSYESIWTVKWSGTLSLSNCLANFTTAAPPKLWP